MKGRERTYGQVPNHCLTGRSAHPETQPLSPHSRSHEHPREEQVTHQDLSSHLRAGRRERRERGKAESEEAGRGGSGALGTGGGGREDGKHLSLIFGLEPQMGTGLGINFKVFA